MSTISERRTGLAEPLAMPTGYSAIGRYVPACFSAVAPLNSNSATGGQDTNCCLAKTDR